MSVVQASDGHGASTVGALNAVLQHLPIRSHLLRRVALLHVDDGQTATLFHTVPQNNLHDQSPVVSSRSQASLASRLERTQCSAAALTAASVSAVKVLLPLDSSKVMGPVTLAVQEGPSWTKMM